jgi:hypothetical protein
MSPFQRSLGVLLFLLAPVVPALAQKSSPPAKSFFPPLLLCGKKNTLSHATHGKVDWDYELDGPLLDIQPQPSGYFLVTGGTGHVSLLRKVWKGCRVLWDWRHLDDLSVVSAVGADWDTDGNPSLVLAADVQNQRLFLAEAKSKNIKIRWEYKLPAPPLRVHLCPDTGNFLVTMKGSLIQEIQFQEDKVAWSLGPEAGLVDARDAVRGPWANTFVADAKDGAVLSFSPHQKLNWKTILPFAPSHPLEGMTLSLFKKNGKRIVMVSAHFSRSGPVAKDVIYLLNAETGKVMAWSDRLEKGGYPSLTKAAPDLAVYQKKQ